MDRFFNMKKTKYLFLLLSTVYLALSINFFIYNVSTVGMDPYYNITAGVIEGEEEFVLKVKQENELYLQLKTEIGKGNMELKLTRDDGRAIFEHSTDGNDFVNKVITLDEGSYFFKIKRDAIEYKESLRLYYDKRHITREKIKTQHKTSNSNL